MKKKTIFFSMLAIVMMVITFNQNATSKATLDLIFENVEALAAGETTGPGTGRWFVSYNGFGHDCWGMGSWCCPGLDCK